MFRVESIQSNPVLAAQLMQQQNVPADPITSRETTSQQSIENNNNNLSIAAEELPSMSPLNTNSNKSINIESNFPSTSKDSEVVLNGLGKRHCENSSDQAIKRSKITELLESTNNNKSTELNKEKDIKQINSEASTNSVTNQINADNIINENFSNNVASVSTEFRLFEDVHDVKPNISNDTYSNYQTLPINKISAGNKLPDLHCNEENQQDQWDDYCYVCNQGCDDESGVLGCCNKCPHVFHNMCHIPSIPIKMDELP